MPVLLNYNVNPDFNINTRLGFLCADRQL